MTTIVTLFLVTLAIYLVLGFIFGFVFAFAGCKSIDPGAVDGTWGFKLIIIPGCALFWPYLLKRWVGKSHPPEERSEHRRAAKR